MSLWQKITIKKTLADISIEMASIIAAVFIALWVDQWWEDKQSAERANDALARIVKEIESNYQIISDDYAFNVKQMQEVAPILQTLKEDKINESDMQAELNVDVDLLADTAWQTAKTTNIIKHLPDKTVNHLTNISVAQELYSDRIQASFVEMGRVEFTSADNIVKLRTLHLHVGILMQLQRALKSSYTSFLCEQKTTTINKKTLDCSKN